MIGISSTVCGCMWYVACSFAEGSWTARSRTTWPILKYQNNDDGRLLGLDVEETRKNTHLFLYIPIWYTQRRKTIFVHLFQLVYNFMDNFPYGQLPEAISGCSICFWFFFVWNNSCFIMEYRCLGAPIVAYRGGACCLFASFPLKPGGGWNGEALLHSDLCIVTHNIGNMMS